MTPTDYCRAPADAEWIFDFFAIGYDYLLHFPPQDQKSPEHAVRDAIVDAEKAGLSEDIELADGEIPDSLYSFLGVSKDTLQGGEAAGKISEPSFWPRLLASVRAIDRAVESLSPFTFGHGTGTWPETLRHCLRNNWQLERDGSRPVRFKPPDISSQPWFTRAEAAGLKASEARGQFHYRYFRNLSRVPETPECRVTVSVPDAFHDIAELLTGPLRVAICPVTDDLSVGKTEAVLGPGGFRIVVDAARSRFSVLDDRADPDLLKGILQDAVVGAVSGQADLLLFPELTIPDSLLKHLQEYLRQMVVDGRRTPRLVLAGTWVRDGADGRFNEAILLNDRGQILLRQRKMHRYGMQAYEQSKYGLEELFGGTSTIEEDADVTPRNLCFLDSRSAGMRLAILTCEDLCEPSPGVSLARDFSASIVFSPIMAGPLSKECGFYSNANSLATNPGTLVCVANSGALARTRWHMEGNVGEPPLGLIAAPLYSKGFPGIVQLTAAGPAQLLTFSLP